MTQDSALTLPMCKQGCAEADGANFFGPAKSRGQGEVGRAAPVLGGSGPVQTLANFCCFDDGRTVGRLLFAGRGADLP